MNTASFGGYLRSRPVPLASFTAVMGIVGTGLDLRFAHVLGYGDGTIGDAIVTFGVAVFLVLSVRWLLRIWSDRHELGTESRTVAAHFYGTIVISLALTSAGVAPCSLLAARVLWFVSAVGGAALLLYLFGRWIETGVDDAELTPAIFLPVVGNATSVYVAGVIGVESYAWFSFSLAAVCWMALLPLSVYRLIVVKPRLPRRLAPQLGILVASPAVLANAWFVLNGGRADDAFKILACASLFFALLTIRSWRLAWGEPFNVAMWGWTFPAAALAGSFERIALVSPSVPSTTLALALLWLAIAVTAACTAGTVWGWQHEAAIIPMLQPEHRG
jgi:tellurite resistance protein